MVETFKKRNGPKPLPFVGSPSRFFKQMASKSRSEFQVAPGNSRLLQTSLLVQKAENKYVPLIDYDTDSASEGSPCTVNTSSAKAQHCSAVVHILDSDTESAESVASESLGQYILPKQLEPSHYLASYNPSASNERRRFAVARFGRAVVDIEHYASLAGQNKLSTEIIDVVASVFTKQSSNLAVVDWLNSTKIFGLQSFDLKAKKKPFHVDLTETVYLLFPYIAQGHYTLIVFDFLNQKVIQHNPLKEFQILKKGILKKALDKYLATYNTIYKACYTSKNWTYVDVDLEQQSDAVSCGVFVLWYIQLYASSQLQNRPVFNQRTFREFLMKHILEESDDLRGSCRHCGTVPVKASTRCSLCKWSICKACAERCFQNEILATSFVCNLCATTVSG